MGAVADKLMGLAHVKARAQLQPDVPDPTRAVDFKDIFARVDAFQGASYRYEGPSGCR